MPVPSFVKIESIISIFIRDDRRRTDGRTDTRTRFAQSDKTYDLGGEVEFRDAL
jgi:hypothetical protein